MKKIISISILVLTLLVSCMTIEAKPGKKNSRKTSQSTSTKLAMFKNVYKNDIYLMKDGTVKLSDKNAGKWYKTDGSNYIVNIDMGDGIEGVDIYFIVNNSAYHICSGDIILGNDKASYSVYSYANAHGWNKTVSYNSSNRTLTIKSDNGTYTLSLSKFGSPQKITWY